MFSACLNNMNPGKNSIQESPKKYESIRYPAVAGQFYPQDKTELEEMISKLLDGAPERKASSTIKAIMVPHAGYIYSGSVAANSYKALTGQRIDNVFLVCNGHSDYFKGVAVDESDAWETPLGLVEVNTVLARKIVDAHNDFNYNGDAHSTDHTLEVQIPFLQKALGDDFKIIPLLFGQAGNNLYKELALTLSRIIGENDLLLISTDLSHYPEYKDANNIDNQTLNLIKAGNIGNLEKHISDTLRKRIPGVQTLCCGINGVETVMELSELLGWDDIKILKYANSGDEIIGDKKQVVGYGAVIFADKKQQPVMIENKIDALAILNSEQKRALLNIARQTVEAYVKGKNISDFKTEDERLKWTEGAFVTIHKNGELRGCIGQIIPAQKPLFEVVRDMAVSACSQDYRFNPVSENELKDLDYEVSVLSVPEKIDDWQKIELGKHGVIVKSGTRSGVFLPQVADDTGWSKEEFLGQLCWQKAGLPPDCYKDKNIRLEVFTAQVFSEKDIL